MSKKANVWKPTAEQCAQIRAVAKRGCSGLRRIELGTRVSLTDHELPTSINVARVAKTEKWEDTDLFDMRTWADFRKGVELTDDGRAVLDLFLYDQWGLDSHAIVYYKDGAIVKVTCNLSDRAINNF
mgnify:CR=1 FL=1|jgi:hypothetical protein|uniref:Uncharacterized protein n=1 Tax=Myoviridae sp. ctshb19 TaxID=2825194 RepID=A0A8S5UGL9_9CAUD|nr:MAG TPA: hypothetical protein [Myoviridae sp. ctshb19]